MLAEPEQVDTGAQQLKLAVEMQFDEGISDVPEAEIDAVFEEISEEPADDEGEGDEHMQEGDLTSAELTQENQAEANADPSDLELGQSVGEIEAEDA